MAITDDIIRAFDAATILERTPPKRKKPLKKIKVWNLQKNGICIVLQINTNPTAPIWIGSTDYIKSKISTIGSIKNKYYDHFSKEGRHTNVNAYIGLGPAYKFAPNDVHDALKILSFLDKHT